MRLTHLALAACVLTTAAFAQTVRFETSQGDIDVVLLPESAPSTVANFMNYVNRGAYDNTFFHRLVRGFVAQGGGFVFRNGAPAEIPQDPPVRNEFRVSNTRGTIAMAKLGSGPNTATNQWFFNLADNSRNLNTQNGGFTVFGRVADSAGLTVMDRIAAAQIVNAGEPFDALPVVNFTGGSVTDRNLIVVRSIRAMDTNPAISQGGVVTATAFGGFPSAAPGSFVEIYGANLGGTNSRVWQASDFANGTAPTTLEGVSASINGIPAFVNFVSPGQVNIQVPGGLGSGEGSVVVRRAGQSSPPVPILIKEQAPGILAPSRFKIGDKQYVVALHADGRLVSNGQPPDARDAAPAIPGETLILYGTGFGAVTPAVEPGRITEGAPRINAMVQFFFGDAEAPVSYAGLVPGLVGVYQFNIVVPGNAAAFANQEGDAVLSVLVDLAEIEQRGMLIPVQR